MRLNFSKIQSGKPNYLDVCSIPILIATAQGNQNQILHISENLSILNRNLFAQTSNSLLLSQPAQHLFAK